MKPRTRFRRRSWCWCARATRSGCAIRSGPGCMASPAGLRGGRGGGRSQRRRCQVAIVDDVADAKASGPPIARPLQETEQVIHEEVARLPASLRDPIVLCTLEGLTYDAAARQLGVTEPTLRGRLRRARRRLASRLRERGIASPVPATASPIAIEPFRLAVPALPPALVKSTVQHAVWWSSVSGLSAGSRPSPRRSPPWPGACSGPCSSTRARCWGSPRSWRPESWPPWCRPSRARRERSHGRQGRLRTPRLTLRA